MEFSAVTSTVLGSIGFGCSGWGYLKALLFILGDIDLDSSFIGAVISLKSNIRLSSSSNLIGGSTDLSNFYSSMLACIAITKFYG